MYVSIVFLHSVCSADGNLLVVTVRNKEQFGDTLSLSFLYLADCRDES